MKTTFTLALILTVALGSFTACGSDDDDKGGSSGVAAKVAGTYTGTLTSLGFTGKVDVLVEVASQDEVLVTFGAVAGIDPFKKKLVDTGVQGAIHSTVNPSSSFSTLEGGLIINDVEEIFTFSGKRK